MANELAFEASLDRPKVSASNVETELKCMLKLWPSMELRNLDVSAMETSIALVFDCSGSMVGQKLDTAIESAKMIVDSIHETSVISLIAFQSSIHVLVDNARATDAEKDTIKHQIDQIRALAGGSTNLSDGIKEGARALIRGAAPAKVMIILSDGAADSQLNAEAAAFEATSSGMQLFAVGIGATYEADHLLRLVTPSNGTVFGESEVDKIKATFSDLISRIESFVATNAAIEITFPPDVQAGLAYKTSPEQAFLGNMTLLSSRATRFVVGNIESDKEYSFLFLAIVPQGSEGERQVCTAALTYDVPAMGLTGQRQEVSLRIDYTQDRREAEEVDGEVMEVFRRASITQLAERFVRAYRESDHEQTAKYLQILIRRYDEINDAVMKNHYENILSDLKEQKVITQEMLNASVIASTVVAGGGELPHLVDDDF
jgi:Ca-activated chloride channel homolog